MNHWRVCHGAKTFVVKNVHYSAKVESIKRMLPNCSSLPPDQMRLVYAQEKKELIDGTKLCDYVVQKEKGSTSVLVLHQFMKYILVPESPKTDIVELKWF